MVSPTCREWFVINVMDFFTLRHLDCFCIRLQMSFLHLGLIWKGVVMTILLILYVLLLPRCYGESNMSRVIRHERIGSNHLAPPWLLLYTSTDELSPSWIDLKRVVMTILLILYVLLLPSRAAVSSTWCEWFVMNMMDFLTLRHLDCFCIRPQMSYLHLGLIWKGVVMTILLILYVLLLPWCYGKVQHDASDSSWTWWTFSPCATLIASVFVYRWAFSILDWFGKES
jgi:hypothetical protein